MAKSRTAATQTPKTKPTTLGREIISGLDEAIRHFQGEDVGAKETRVKLTPLARCLAEIKLAREQKGLTLTQVAEKSGLRFETISRMELGKVTNPTIDTLQRYAAAVGVELKFLVSPLPERK